MNVMQSSQHSRYPRRLRRLLIAGLAVLVVLAGPMTLNTRLSEATPRATAGTNTPVLQIPFTTTLGLVLIPVRVDGSRELRCILDTGMPEGVFLLDPAEGEAIGLEYAMQVPVSGTGDGSEMAGYATGSTVDVTGITFENERVIVLEKASHIRLMGVDGVIGFSIFDRYVVEIDHATKLVTLYDPERYEVDGEAAVIPLTVTNTRPYAEVTVTVAEQAKVSLTLVIDSGATGELFLNSPGIDGLDPPAEFLPSIVAEGIGGDTYGVMGRVESLALGSLEVTDLLARFPNESRGSEQGALGMGLLRDFVTVFDYAGKRMILRPLDGPRERTEFNMAGLQLRPMKDGRLRVRAIIDGSPGADADILEDDWLLAIDGQDVTEHDDRGIRRLLTRDGETVVLTLERDGKRMERKVKLRRLI